MKKHKKFPKFYCAFCYKEVMKARRLNINNKQYFFCSDEHKKYYKEAIKSLKEMGYNI